VENPIQPEPYQAQMAIGLGLLDEKASFEKRLTGMRTKVLILFGAHDKVVPPANADLLAEQIPHSEVHILPDAGHFFPIEKPEEANEVIIEFLQK
jgi:pimeloyl-ACP methyl ester carboxylesterase